VPVLCFLKMLSNVAANIASAHSFDEVVIELENEELHHFIKFHLSSGSVCI